MESSNLERDVLVLRDQIHAFLIDDREHCGPTQGGLKSSAETRNPLHLELVSHRFK